ncbi:hypothetical protein EDD11_002640 [Mortierella claussenii]|nr:hypothetical protein EDD11_002640 [Mortierella claussenii]
MPRLPLDGKKKRDGHGDPKRDRDAFLERAWSRQFDELDDIKMAFEDALVHKRPLNPPTHYGHAVQRAWLHSTDPHDYCERLEELIDIAEKRLEKLEERL